MSYFDYSSFMILPISLLVCLLVSWIDAITWRDWSPSSPYQPFSSSLALFFAPIAVLVPLLYRCSRILHYNSIPFCIVREPITISFGWSSCAGFYSPTLFPWDSLTSGRMSSTEWSSASPQNVLATSSKDGPARFLVTRSSLKLTAVGTHLTWTSPRSFSHLRK